MWRRAVLGFSGGRLEFFDGRYPTMGGDCKSNEIF